MDKEKINSSIQLAKGRLMKKYSKGNVSKFSVVLYPHFYEKSNEIYNVFHDVAITMLAL